MLKRAMPSRVASYKKRNGHINEHHFANLIDGEVVGRRTDKTDVVDPEGNTYSVKSLEWWQIFLYVRQRFVDNTEFRQIGNVADIIIDCLDAFPGTREEYEADKVAAKRRLQQPMRMLKDEIRKPTIFPQLLRKGIFNGNEVDFLAILPLEISGGNIPLEQKHFHVFYSSDVVDLLSTKLDVQNSRARGHGQMDAQKVIFRYRNRNVGEIEIRTDSKVHYKQAKWRFNAPSILGLLRSNLEATVVGDKQVSIYGNAREYL